MFSKKHPIRNHIVDQMQQEEVCVIPPNPAVKFKPIQLEKTMKKEFRKIDRWSKEIYDAGLSISYDDDGRYIKLFNTGFAIGPFAAFQSLYEYFKGGHHQKDYEDALRKIDDAPDNEKLIIFAHPSEEEVITRLRDSLVNEGVEVGDAVMVSGKGILNLSYPSVKTSLHLSEKGIFELTAVCHEKWEDCKRLFTKFAEHLSRIEKKQKLYGKFKHYKLWKLKVSEHIEKAASEMIDWCEERYPSHHSPQENMTETATEIYGIWQCLTNGIKKMENI